jgi:hypothetical protein
VPVAYACKKVILVTWEADIRRIVVQSRPAWAKVSLYLKNTQHKKGLVEWLK